MHILKESQVKAISSQQFVISLCGDSWCGTSYYRCSLRWRSSLANRTPSPFLDILRFILLFVVLRQVQRDSATGVGPHILTDTHQSIASLIEHVFETNHNALAIRLASLLNVVADLEQIDCNITRSNKK
jgi:hypothetical protein